MTRFDLHLVSDSTGETLDAVAKAAIAQFKDPQAEKHLWPMVRSLRQLEPVLESIRKLRGPVMFTLVNQD
ncbi:MAG TPA: kinase/pyrophosphorylase, partial [Sphingomonadales bacterium]